MQRPGSQEQAPSSSCRADTLEALPGGRRGASVPPALQRRGRVRMPGPGRGRVLRVLRRGAWGPQGALGKRRGTFH